MTITESATIDKHADITLINQERVSIGRSVHGYGFTYFAARAFSEGELVMSGFGNLIDHQTKHLSVQIDHGVHYLPRAWTGKYWNHSCEPNARVATREDGFPDLIALRDIAKDEEITYAYWMTEFRWMPGADEITAVCHCGSAGCTGKIHAFSDLAANEQERVLRDKLCSDYLHTQP